MGLTYEASVRSLGVSHGAACVDVKMAMKANAERESEEAFGPRQLELERVPAERVREGDQAAIDVWVGACGCSRKLLGPDAWRGGAQGRRSRRAGRWHVAFK